jgi:hypothetical protein
MPWQNAFDSRDDGRVQLKKKGCSSETPQPFERLEDLGPSLKFGCPPSSK